jgi:hypothetical protein
VFQHCAVCRVNAHGTKGEINRAIDIANRICGNHLALNDRENSHVKRASVLLCPRLERNLNTERPDIRVKEIVNLINPGAPPHRIKGAPQPS